ncbi:MAG: YCF48-related protein [Bacteroidetes bacterium]|nr:YCF48-related protein [Bacteroidota bacterium]
MKKLTFFIVSFLLLAGSIYAQSGWVQQYTGTSNHILSLAFPNANTGFACGWSGTSLKTTNGGSNWVNAGAPIYDYQSTFFVDVNTGWMVGHGGAIVKTTNSGISWITQTSGVYVYLMLVNFVDANTGYIAGYSGTVLKTTNGGTSWISQNSGVTVNLLSVKFLDANTGYITGDNSTIIKTTNGGSTWTSLVYGIYNNLGKVAFPNVNTGWVPGTNGLVYKTTNGGNIWTVQGSGNPNYFVSANFLNTSTGYISGAGGSVIKTTNGGTNYVTQTTPTTNELHWIYFINSETGWSCGYYGTIIKTTSGGNPVFTPDAPVLISPVNNSVNQPLMPTLTWNASTYATTYTYQVSTTSVFNNIIDSGTISSTQHIVGNGKLSSGYTYFWRVCANNSYGSSSWSTIWNFSTSVGPDAPNLISPANGSNNVSLTPTLTWSSVSGAVSYLVEISTNSDFTGITDSITTLATQRIVPAGKLSISSTYYWRVRANNNITYGPWSVVWNFSTMGLPSIPVLITPPNGALAVIKTPLMDWNNSANATTYTIQVSTISTFMVITDSATVTTSQYQVPSGKLFDWVTYFWRVKANNSYGSSNWSSVWMFTVYPDFVNAIGGGIPSEFKLYGNYPNPFNPSTKIRFDVPKLSNIKLIIYDALGREVDKLHQGNIPAGRFEYTWNAGKFSSGIYYARLIADEYSDIKRMVLIK